MVRWEKFCFNGMATQVSRFEPHWEYLVMDRIQLGSVVKLNNGEQLKDEIQRLATSSTIIMNAPGWICAKKGTCLYQSQRRPF